VSGLGWGGATMKKHYTAALDLNFLLVDFDQPGGFNDLRVQ
jgi:hypothetical protein